MHTYKNILHFHVKSIFFIITLYSPWRFFSYKKTVSWILKKIFIWVFFMIPKPIPKKGNFEYNFQVLAWCGTPQDFIKWRNVYVYMFKYTSISSDSKKKLWWNKAPLFLLYLTSLPSSTTKKKKIYCQSYYHQ